MGVDLLSVAIVLASCALAVAIFLGIAEAIEAHDITHDGWAHGHRHHRVLGVRGARFFNR